MLPEIIYIREDREYQHYLIWKSGMLLQLLQKQPEEMATNKIYFSDKSNQPLNVLAIWTSIQYYRGFFDGISPSDAL